MLVVDATLPVGVDAVDEGALGVFGVGGCDAHGAAVGLHHVEVDQHRVFELDGRNGCAAFGILQCQALQAQPCADFGQLDAVLFHLDGHEQRRRAGRHLLLDAFVADGAVVGAVDVPVVFEVFHVGHGVVVFEDAVVGALVAEARHIPAARCGVVVGPVVGLGGRAVDEVGDRQRYAEVPVVPFGQQGGGVGGGHLLDGQLVGVADEVVVVAVPLLVVVARRAGALPDAERREDVGVAHFDVGRVEHEVLLAFLRHLREVHSAVGVHFGIALVLVEAAGVDVVFVGPVEVGLQAVVKVHVAVGQGVVLLLLCFGVAAHSSEEHYGQRCQSDGVVQYVDVSHSHFHFLHLFFCP